MTPLVKLAIMKDLAMFGIGDFVKDPQCRQWCLDNSRLMAELAKDPLPRRPKGHSKGDRT